ncbi:hypothetical protein N9Z02_01700, partial [Akkermansiaceae bacterium]|nr:hypothetical protein [Akkermansiaceae bacterium]
MNQSEVEKAKHQRTHWASCPDCQGRGKRNRRLSGKARRRYQNALAQFEALGKEGPAPVRPKGHRNACTSCQGSGVISAPASPLVDEENYPHVAIIGGGIGGVALAVACLHRGIPYTLYERDGGFDERSQGYGLTLQQASKAIEGLGILSLDEGIVSTRHLVHTPEGKVLGEWGGRKWLESNADKLPKSKRINIHIARQSLRLALLEQLHGQEAVRWGHQL